jgi:hypothetical protein
MGTYSKYTDIISGNYPKNEQGTQTPAVKGNYSKYANIVSKYQTPTTQPPIPSAPIENIQPKQGLLKSIFQKVTPPVVTPTITMPQITVNEPIKTDITPQITPEAVQSSQLRPELKNKMIETVEKQVKKTGEVIKPILVETAKRTSGTGIAATIKSASPEVTFKQAYESMRKSQQENNTLPKQVVTGLIDSLPQTALGVALGFIPVAGPSLAIAYWSAISAGSEIEEKGYATPTNVAIDVLGDRLLGNVLEKLLKAPAKSLIKTVKKSFVVEGGTEVAQDLLKFANDFRLAKDEKERDSVLQKAKDYFTSGQILVTAGVGGISGAGIAAGAGGISKLVGEKETKIPSEIEEKIIPEVKTTVEKPLTAPDNLLISHEGAPDKVTVEEYKTKIQSGKIIEPVKVIREGEKYGIEDGKHRFEAMQELGIKNIPIEIVEASKPQGVIPEVGGKNQIAGLDTSFPSNKTVAVNLPDTVTQSPSLKTNSSIPSLSIRSTRYVSPSQVINLDDTTVPIQRNVTSIIKNSQENVVPFTSQIKQATGITPDVRVKSESSLIGKIERYKLKNKSANEISDVLAGKIETNFNDIPKQIENIKNNFNTLEVENYIDSPSTWGYRGVNTKVKLPNGSIAEIQIHTPESWKITKSIHPYYENWRNLDISKLTESQTVLMEKDMATSLKIANDIWSQSPSIPEVKPQEIKINIDQTKTIKDVKTSLKSIKTEFENLKTEAEGIAVVSKEQRTGLNVNNIAKLKRIYNRSQKFKEGDIETIRASKSGQLVDSVIENIQLKYPQMSEQEAFDFALALPTKTAETIRPSIEMKSLIEKQKTLNKYLDLLKTKQDALKLNQNNEAFDEWKNALFAQEEAAKIISVPRSQLPVGEGAEKVSKLEARVKKTLDNISQETIDKLGLSTYNELNKKENIKLASEYVIKNPEEALKVLSGEIEAPKGILRNAIYVAMQNQAIGSVDLAMKLASITSTRLGQEIGILTEIDPDSPVKIISDIIKIREETVQKRYGNRSIKQITDLEVKKIKSQVKTPGLNAWEQFLKEIQC